MKNLFLEKYLKGEKSLGTFTHLLSAPAVEALARAGMDYVIIDIEHSPIGAEHAAELVGVAAGAGLAMNCHRQIRCLYRRPDHRAFCSVCGRYHLNQVALDRDRLCFHFPQSCRQVCCFPTGRGLVRYYRADSTPCLCSIFVMR